MPLIHTFKKIFRQFLIYIVLAFVLTISCTHRPSTTNKPAMNTTYLIHYQPYRSDDISCYNQEAEQNLPSIDENFNPPEKSIFFFETSCKGGLDSRQACTIESAARSNPNWQINVLFTGPVRKGLNLKSLQEYHNVKLSKINIYKLSERTPIENLLKRGALNESQEFRIYHAADVLKYMSLYKWGGVSLDLDMMVVRSFDTLAKNWGAKEFIENGMGAAAMGISRDVLGRKVALTAIRYLSKHYNSSLWIENGIGVITNTLKRICSTIDVSLMSAATCRGFEVYATYYFSPIFYDRARDYYFKPGDLILGPAYGLHMFNEITHSIPVTKDSRFARLAKIFCPIINTLYGDDFGS